MINAELYLEEIFQKKGNDVTGSKEALALGQKEIKRQQILNFR